MQRLQVLSADVRRKSVDINHVREKIGMVFQQFNLFPNMTIKENIMLAPVKLNKMTREEAEKKAMELLKKKYGKQPIYYEETSMLQNINP